MIVRNILAVGILPLTAASVHADTFGSGANAFNIGFVTIGNSGNGADAGAGGGIYSSPYGGVSYSYRMGVTEVAYHWIVQATASGMTNVPPNGIWSYGQPAGGMQWVQMAAFVNWLNTSTGHQAAYNLTWTGSAWTMNLWNSTLAWQMDGQNLFRHMNAYYFLPNEHEWYKAAYHKNDGVTGNYWDYATGSNTIPTAAAGTNSGTAVYDGAGDINSNMPYVDQMGGLSSYGTQGQNGG